MIDNIKCYFTASLFNGNFERCVLREKKESRTEFTLRNPHNNAHISVWKHSNGVVTLKGSLRKWYYGDFSNRDLTLPAFIKATKHIADLLNVPWDIFNKAKISQTEIGLSVPLSIPFSELRPKIVSYGTHHVGVVRGKGMTRDNYGTLYFGERDCEFRLKIYDKSKEILDKDILSEGDTAPNLIRIEFTLDDKDTFKRKGLPPIANIRGLIEHWEKLYELWAKEVGRITILSNISDSEDFAIDDILCAEALNLYPWKENIENFEEYITEHYKTKVSINNAKSKLNKRINNLLDNHSNPNEYRKINFYKDIISYLIEQEVNGERINLSLMIALLHSNTHYVCIEK